MRIIGKNSKGKKVLITVPDWDIPIIGGGVENNGSNASGSSDSGGGSSAFLTNLTAYYSFDAALEANRGNDSHTNSYNLVGYPNIGGQVNWRTGKNGLYALDPRNNLNQTCYFRDATSPAPGTTYFDFNNKSYTIAFWFKQDSTDEGAVNTHFMVGWSATTTISVDVRLTNDFAGKLDISYNQYNGSTLKTLYNGKVTKDVWNHAVARYNSSTNEMKLSINNVTTTLTATGAASLSGNPRIFYIGHNPYSADAGYAYIDEVAVWYRALSDSDVTNLYNSGTGVFYSSFTA